MLGYFVNSRINCLSKLTVFLKFHSHINGQISKEFFSSNAFLFFDYSQSNVFACLQLVKHVMSEYAFT